MSKLKPYLSFLIPLVITLSISYYLQYKVLTNQAEFTAWLSTFGPFIIFIYLVLQAITIIIAPIGGFFLVVAMMSLFGPEKALLISYFGTAPIYLINFWLARKYGRPFVKKVLGETALVKVDHLVKDAGLAILIMTRVLQSGNFDYISYGWGLTKISFRTFALVNFIAGIPGVLMSYFVIISFDNLIYGVLAFYAITGILGGITICLTHVMKRHKFRK